jgi:hypothetical protein
MCLRCRASGPSATESRRNVIAAPGYLILFDLSVHAGVATELAGCRPFLGIEQAAEESKCAVLAERTQSRQTAEMAFQNRRFLPGAGQHPRCFRSVLPRFALERLRLLRFQPELRYRLPLKAANDVRLANQDCTYASRWVERSSISAEALCSMARTAKNPCGLRSPTSSMRP